jgi:UDP-glucose 4,6-dehydratase
MNILVTGGCGFIGSHFINFFFNKYDCTIICLDALYYCASINNIDEDIRNNPRYKMIHGNLNDYKLIVEILTQNNITHIVHYAAQSHVDNSFNESLQYTEDNVKGTHTLLEAIKNTSLDIILLHFSTDEVYGESMIGSDIMKTETSILSPTNPYAASKAAAEMYVMSYIHSFNLKAIITRGNNVYGKNQYPEKLIPKFIELLKKGEKCTIHGSGSTVRNFIHVDDVSSAVDIIIHRGRIGSIYNIGGDPSNEYSVIEVATMLIKYIHGIEDTIDTISLDHYITFVPDRPFNDKRYFISNDKLRELGWVQKIDFINGLKNMI